MERNLKITLAAILSLFTTIKASPFELTDAYIANFRTGLDELKSLSHSYKYEEINSVPLAENTSDIITGQY